MIRILMSHTRRILVNLQYNWKVTLAVNRWSEMTAGELTKLNTMSAYGHEVAAHENEDAVAYLTSNTAQDYLDNIVDPYLALMSADGYTPASWAYPNNNRNEELDAVLYTRFNVLRGKPIEKWWDGTTLVSGQNIDYASSIPMNTLRGWCREAKGQGKVLMLYAHKPVEAINTGVNEILNSYLTEFCQFVDAINLEWLTFTDVYNKI